MVHHDVVKALVASLPEDLPGPSDPACAEVRLVERLGWLSCALWSMGVVVVVELKSVGCVVLFPNGGCVAGWSVGVVLGVGGRACVALRRSGMRL